MKKSRSWILLAVAVAACPVSVVAQQPPLNDPLLDHLAGTWVLRGTIDGKQVVHNIDAGWVLEHHYMRIHELSTEQNPDGNPAYEATVFVGWNRSTAEYGCAWLDTYGGLSPQSLGTGKRAGDELRFVFKNPDGLFRTTFAYNSAAGTWDWRMDQETQGKQSAFLRASLKPLK